MDTPGRLTLSTPSISLLVSLALKGTDTLFTFIVNGFTKIGKNFLTEQTATGNNVIWNGVIPFKNITTIV